MSPRDFLRLPLLWSASLSLLLSSACTNAAPRSPEPAAESETPSKDAASIGGLAPGEPHSALPVEDDDARQGNPDAHVTIVAFLDFQCGFCAQGFATLLKLRAEYSDEDLRVVFKHMPLRFHEQAVPAAIAGQAVTQVAGSDAFFHFARLAFENQSALGFENFAKWSLDVGVPRDLYNEEIGSEEVLKRVAQDASLARRVGIEATPAFFINGVLVAGSQPIDVFRKAIEAELLEMKKHPKQNWQSAYQKRITTNMQGSLAEALLAQDPGDLLVPIDGSPTDGDPNALVTLVVFTDFECPFCKRAEKTIKALKAKYGRQLRVVFKHLPLHFHQMALPAARLSAMIHQQRGDKAFFEAAEELFTQSPQLKSDLLHQIGRSHGLDSKQIDRTLKGEIAKVNERLERDRILADNVLARGTPHFFINGKRLSGARPYEHFEALIEHEKKRALSLIAEGVSLKNLYSRLQEAALSPGAPQRLEIDIPEEGHPIRGASEAKISIHIFSDFECPYCRRGELHLAELMELYPNEIRLVWHDLPLAFHERARPAARAGRFAFQKKGNKGFWRMHSALFGLEQEEPRLSSEQIASQAEALGLVPSELSEALESKTYDDAIDKDVALAESLGIRGTPAYVIGGYVVTGARPVHHLIRIVELALKEQGSAKAIAR